MLLIFPKSVGDDIARRCHVCVLHTTRWRLELTDDGRLVISRVIVSIIRLQLVRRCEG